jgi:hypothetical protein
VASRLIGQPAECCVTQSVRSVYFKPLIGPLIPFGVNANAMPAFSNAFRIASRLLAMGVRLPPT